MNRLAINQQELAAIQPRGCPELTHCIGGEGGRGRMSRRALVVVDGRVPHADAILAALTVPADVVRIDPDRDGLAQMVAAAQAAPGRLVVVCHGEPGALALGDEPLTGASLARRLDDLAALGRALAGAPVELYACRAGSGSAGRALLALLAAATGCAVAAATGDVGGTALGGTWRLDAGRPAQVPALDAAALATLPVRLANTDVTAGINTINLPLVNAADGDTLTLISDGGSYTFNYASVRSITVLLGAGVTSATLTGNPNNAVIQNYPNDSDTFTAQVDLGQTLAMNVSLFQQGTGTLGLSKTGDGLLTLQSSASSVAINTGTTTVSAGTLRLAGGTALGDGSPVSVAAGATLDLNGSSETVGSLSGAGDVTLGAGTLSLAQAADTTFSGVISGTGNLTKDGAGTLTLSGTNTYTGTTTVSGGTVSIAADGNLGGGVVTLDGGGLQVTGAITVDNAIALSSTATVTADADVILSGVISGAGSLTKDGAGSLTLSGANTYTGTTTISAGTLVLSGGNAISDSASVDVAAGATLDLNGTSETIGALTGSGAVTVGAGSLTLSDATASTFTGTLSGTGTFNVASGVILKGTGIYSTPVTIMSGATIAPGNSPGTISTGNLTLASGSTASMEIDGTTAGTQYDQIAVTGTVTINNATLNTVFGYTSSTGHSYVLISNDGVDAVTGTFDGLAEGASFHAGGRIYRISYAGNDGNDVTLTDIGTPGGDGSSGATGPYHLVGGAGNETFFGTDWADTVFGMAGDDYVLAASGDDVAYGNQDADTLVGNAGADMLYGGQGSDIVYGNQGGDALYGNMGADAIYGGQDGDRVFGGQGADILYGNLADDLILGGIGDDVVYGGQGADTLSGGAGNDLLVGGTGADRYALGSGDGADTISGFSSAEGDVIAVAADVNGTGIASVADLLARLSGDQSGGTVLDLGSGHSVTLIGVPPASAAADWFMVA